MKIAAILQCLKKNNDEPSMKKADHNKTKQKSDLLLCILLGGALFFIWQILYFFIKAPVWNISLILLSGGVHLPFKSALSIILYWLNHLLLYTLFLLLIYTVAKLVSNLFHLSEEKQCRLGLTLLFLSILCVLTANQISYPLSIFSLLTQQLFTKMVATILFFVTFFTLSSFAALATFTLLKKKIKLTVLKISLFLFAGFLLVVYMVYETHTPAPEKLEQHYRPNVIIIGLDAIRPDYINPSNTPTLHNFLNQSIQYTEAFTPLARTFPAWTSILTGQYPKHTSARFTFLYSSDLPFDDMLPAQLKKENYTTVYATDESDFDNIEKQFGFDKIIRPKNGAESYIINQSNDFPLSNLLINTKIGAFLFPCNYGSRSAYTTYSPRSFLNMTDSALKKIKHRPLFLAIHFCLPHWPYVWADSSPEIKPTEELYESALHKIDQQFSEFLTQLKRYNLLNNTVMIVLSDHGEGLGLHGDRLIKNEAYIRGPSSHSNLFKKLKAVNSDQPDLDLSTQHGTDVLSLSQNKILLAIRFFGSHKNIHKQISTPASLIDIKPTILTLLRLKETKSDGIPLLPFRKIETPEAQNRPLFIETGLTPSAIKSKTIDLQEVAYQTSQILAIDPVSTQIRINPSALKILFFKKQRAIYYKEWILALYPQKQNKVIPILANRHTGQWTDDLSTEFAKTAPLDTLLSEMKAFYDNEINLQHLT